MIFNKIDPIFLRKIIIKHYSKLKYKGLTKKNNSYLINQSIESCIDNIYLELTIKNNRIIKPCFDGVGCIISIVSSNIMAQELENNTINSGLKIIENYLSMIFNKKYNKKKLNDLIAFVNIKKQPNRIKCATLGTNGFKILLLNNIKNK